MAFQYKTLFRIAPAALLIIGFQNCAPQKFSQTSAASEKSFATDGTTVGPTGGLPGSTSTSTPNSTNTTGASHEHDGDTDHNSNRDGDQDHGHASDQDHNGKKIGDTLPPVTPDETRASTCKSLREKFIAMNVKPAAMTTIKASGQSDAGPYFISGVDKIESSGQSDVYVVGSDANAMAKDIKVSGQGHVVLCGVYAGNVKTSGESIVDVIGANVLGDTKQSGNANINILDQDGNPLK